MPIFWFLSLGSDFEFQGTDVKSQGTAFFSFFLLVEVLGTDSEFQVTIFSYCFVCGSTGNRF